jgi:hypothetical protein
MHGTKNSHMRNFRQLTKMPKQEKNIIRIKILIQQLHRNTKRLKKIEYVKANERQEVQQ